MKSQRPSLSIAYDTGPVTRYVSNPNNRNNPLPASRLELLFRLFLAIPYKANSAELAPLTDYPAAHSMDTDWFAVDADGKIGLFNTNEDGALPKNACARGSECFNTLFVACCAEACWEATLSIEAEDIVGIHPCAGLADPAEEESRKNYENSFRWSLKPCWIALSSVDGVRLGSKDRCRFASFGPLWLSLRPLAARTIRRIVSTGVKVFDVERLFYAVDVSPSEADKVFCFRRSFGDEPGLYTREAVPSHPLKAKDLPWKEVAHLSLLTDFEDHEFLHLADFMKTEEAYLYDHTWTLRSNISPWTTPNNEGH